MNGSKPKPPNLKRAKLPAWLRWEWDGERATVSFRCQCSLAEVQTYMAQVTEDGSSMTARCRNCRELLQLRASEETET